ncbi:MAG: CoA transferase [Dehalococcoidia bacterium]
MPNPCEGLRIVDFTHSYPGALATMVLADSGAEVIKVEPPGGDPTRRHYASVMWHRGKKSAVLDLKTEGGRADARRLASQADVVIESFRPGVADRLGIGYDALAQSNPGLVYCSITGFGPNGPLAGVRAYEGIVHAKAGRMDAFWGLVDKDGPVYSSQPLASYGAAMLAVQGVMAALIVRNRSGRGQKVETSLVQALTCYDLASYLAWQLVERGGDPVRRGYSGGPIPPYMTARTRDGHWLQFGNFTVDTLRNFLNAIGLADTLQDPRFAAMPQFANPEDEAALQRMVLEKTLEKTRDEWMELFIDGDIGAEPFRTTQEGLHHPQAVHNGNVIDLEDPTVGPTRQLGPLGRYAETPTGPQGPAPTLGEHTDAVLRLLDGAGPRAPRRNGTLPKHPLSGVTVLEFASFIAAPFVTCLLADLGARVIKIEPVTGDLYRSIAFPRMCKTLQGKEALCLDLKDPVAQEAIHKLVEKADVLLHNFRPGVPERLRIDYETVRKINPRILYVYAGAYGSSGPHHKRVGFHPLAGAITGGPRYQVGQSVIPPRDQPMTLDEVQEVSDILRRSNEVNPDPAAALACASATMVALYHREVTGKGQYLETSMLAGNLYANADDAVAYQGKPERPWTDDDFNGLNALYRLYKTQEGWLFLACPSDKEWRGLAEAMGRPDLLDEPRFASQETREANDADLASVLARVFAGAPAGEWERTLTAKDVACVEVFEGDNGKFLLDNPWAKEAGLLVETEHRSLGRYLRQGPPFTFSLTPGAAGPNIYLGEHTRQILQELGYDDGAIDELERAGVAVTQDPAATGVA